MNTAYSLSDTDMLHADVSSRYILRVRDMAEADKPRERLLAHGPQGLALAELVAILWGTGTRREDVLSMSRRLLREYGERAVLHETDPKRLASALDIPLGKACQVIACLELGRRFYAKGYGDKPVYVRTSQQAYHYVRPIAHSQKEQLRGLYLSSRYEVIHDEVISVGTLTASIIHPREVFQPALTHGAAAVIVAHNHPSGDSTPTEADREITLRLREAGELLGIELLDHLVVTPQQYYSIIEGTMSV